MKFAITFIHTSLHFCDLVKKVGNCKLAFVQNGVVGENVYWGHGENKFECDYYFTYCNNWVKYSQNYLKAKYVISGSIIGNNFPLSKHKKIKRIQWISQWRDYPDYIVLYGRAIKSEDMFKPMRISLQVVSEFCEKNNLSLEIIGIGSKYKKEESKFYSKFLDRFEFLSKDSHSPYLSYRQISDDAIICGNDSMLLYESFARNYRTAFFTIVGHYINDPSRKFNWPNATEDFGEFWCSSPKKSQMENVLNYLLYVNQDIWIKQVSKYENVIKYDPKNSIIRHALKDEGVYIND